MTCIEHLRAFAKPLGVSILLENIPNEFSAPEKLVEEEKNLTVSQTIGGGIVLKGSLTSHSTVPTTFPQVRTVISKCAPSVAADTCTGAAVYGVVHELGFSGTSLPTPLELQPEQIVQVTVTISFTSPSPIS